MPSILLHNKDKRLTQVSVWLNEGCQIISGELLTKVGLQEPWSITDGYKVTSFSYHRFILIHNSLYDSHNYGVSRFKDSATYLISGRSLYVKLSFNAVRRSKIHARSWKNTSKIGFWTTWLRQMEVEFQSFTWHPANLELSPVESYQIFHFVNLMEGRVFCRQT